MFVTITETRSKLVKVDAYTPESAITIVEQQYKDRDVILERCDVNDVIFEFDS